MDQTYPGIATLRAMALTEDDLEALQSEGEFEGWVDEQTADRRDGCTDWVGYLPSCNRAVWLTNGDPEWFDADSLEDAVAQIKSGAELIH